MIISTPKDGKLLTQVYQRVKELADALLEDDHYRIDQRYKEMDDLIKDLESLPKNLKKSIDTRLFALSLVFLFSFFNSFLLSNNFRSLRGS